MNDIYTSAMIHTIDANNPISVSIGYLVNGEKIEKGTITTQLYKIVNNHNSFISIAYKDNYKIVNKQNIIDIKFY